MKLLFISPRLAIQKGDFLGSGVPYWPLELATLAQHVRSSGYAVSVIDLFGSSPTTLTETGDYYLQGLPIEKAVGADSGHDVGAIVLYAISYMSHFELLRIARFLKVLFPQIPVAVLENSQAVTAYSLAQVADAFFDAGADALICGEPYHNWGEIVASLRGGAVPENVVTAACRRGPHRIYDKVFDYPVPAWDLFPIENYWRLPYSHGPKTKRFLPLLTSRGCPYPCDFCVVPETNDRSWRGNSPEAVVEEIIALRDRHNVYDFQIEDLNPTVQHKRWERICELLIARNARIRFYFVSGTKAETVHIEKVPLLAQAGCRYISISPESGSPNLMKRIGKKFDHEHGLRLVAACRASGIRTQACLLVGHPDETEDDFLATRRYLRQLITAGLDEVAVFVVAAFAGSRLYRQNAIAIADSTSLPTFSPKGRADYATLERRRQLLIRDFFLGKLGRGLELWAQGVRAILGWPQTKMENLPRRIAYIYWLLLRNKLSGFLQ